MQLQLVSDGTFKKVRNNIDRLFDKNLTDLIRGIRNNKENEARYVATCIGEIKAELRQDSTFVKANAIEKLAYLQMLGYDISWAAFNIIEVMASTRFSEKRIGYLAATQAFNDETDVLMLTTNLIRKDLQSSTNIYDIGVALNGLSCFVTTDLARDLVNDVVNLLSSSRPYVRKKALLLLYKIFTKYPESLRSTFTRLKERLEDQDPGVQSAAVNVICELARKNPRNYIGLQNVFFDLLNTSSNNWMLIKIIKLFGSLVPYEPKLGRRLLVPLTNLINSTSAMSLLYECINTVIAILISISSEGPGDYTPSIQLCVQKLGVLIDDSDQNLKYLGLLAMGKILQTHPKAVQAHKDIVLRCLEDKDESIRIRALDLLYGMVSKKNIVEIVRRLMEHLDAAEGSFYRDELLRRIIAICSYESYKHVQNFEWYMSVLVELTRVEGTKHGSLIAEQIMDVAVRVQSVRHFAVSQMVLLVQNAHLLFQGNSVKRSNMAEVLLSAAWICGEFAQHVPDITALLNSMLRLKLSTMPGALLSVYVQNMAKLYALQVCRLEAEEEWDGIESLDNLLSSKMPEFQFTEHLEAQERACNFIALLRVTAEKHAERVKIGAILAKHFEGELNPVAAKAQRKVPVPVGLDLDEWINEPEPDSEEEEAWKIGDESEPEETAERILSSPEVKKRTTSHYGGENLPHHGRKRSTPEGRANREHSPASYHQEARNGMPLDGGDRQPKKKPSVESTRQMRQTEQENNPFYVKDRKRPTQVASASSSAHQPYGQTAQEFLQSPLEIEGVVGMDRYLAQKDATLSWSAIASKGKKKKKKQKEEEESGWSRRNKKKKRGRSEEADEEEEHNEEAEEPVGEQHFVYKGDGEMPEGALDSPEEEEERQLNDDFNSLDIEMEGGRRTGRRRKKSSPESIRPTEIAQKEGRARRLKGKKTEDGGKHAEKTGKKKQEKGKKEAQMTEEAAEQHSPEKSEGRRKKKLTGKKSKELRKDYASIDSPTNGDEAAAATGEAAKEEQLISFGDDAPTDG